MNIKEIEKYIDKKAGDHYSKPEAWGDKNAYKYGSALGILANCLEEMTPDQIQAAIGPQKRDAARLGLIK